MTVWERAVAALAARALDGGLLDSLRGESLSALSPEDAAARKARRTLEGRLTDGQAAALGRIETLYGENLSRCLRFGFSRGACACFEQQFSPDVPEDPFEEHVQQDLLTLPGMAREEAYCANRRVAAVQQEMLAALLDKEGGEALFALCAFWDELEYGVLWRAFGLGYRAALALIDGAGMTPHGRAAAALRRFEARFAADASAPG